MIIHLCAFLLGEPATITMGTKGYYTALTMALTDNGRRPSFISLFGLSES